MFAHVPADRRNVCSIHDTNPTAKAAPKSRRRIPPGLLRRSEAARYLGIGVSTLDRLNAAGQVPEPIRLGGALAWSRRELAAFIDHGCPVCGWRDRRGRSFVVEGASDTLDWLTADAHRRIGWPARGKKLGELLIDAAESIAPSPDPMRGTGGNEPTKSEAPPSDVPAPPSMMNRHHWRCRPEALRHPDGGGVTTWPTSTSTSHQEKRCYRHSAPGESIAGSTRRKPTPTTKATSARQPGKILPPPHNSQSG